MVSNEPILVDIIADVVESMRATGVITESNEVVGKYTISSINELNNKEVISINDVDYVVRDVTSKSFSINAATGLDFSGYEWKSLAPYYEHGHPLEIANTLSKKKNDIHTFKKYPLIALLQDFDEVNDDSLDFYATATPTIVIVNFTDRNIKADERYDVNYRNILYPIYGKFLNALYRNGGFNIRSPKTISHTKTDAPYYGTSEDNGNTANKMNDPLDAIVLKNVELQMIYKECNKY